MAEDEAAEVNLIAAIKRVHQLPWPKMKEKALWAGLHSITNALNLDIVKIEPPVAPAGADHSQTPALETDNGKK